MGVIKCCVPNCSSKRDNGILLHSFPRAPNRRNLWLKQINCEYLNSLNFSQIMGKKVCAKHFELKFYENGRLLSLIARPTLFTAAEISSGIPNIQNDELYNVNKILNCLRDHTYYNTVHLVDQQPNLYADSGTLFADMTTCALQQIENPCNSVIKPNELPCKKRRPDGSQPNVPVENSKSIENVSVQKPTSRYEDIVVDNIEDEEPAEISIEDAVEGQFSWQQSSAVVPCDADLLDQEEEGTPFFADDDQSKTVNEEARQTDTAVYHCNECEQEILGYRYICVQCSDYDLCSTCEGKGLHFLHYVLRVPACKSQVEVEAVLAVVRRVINSLDLNHDQELEIKEETEVLLDEENPKPSLDRDPFADDASVAESGTVPLESQILSEDHDSVHSDPMQFESGPVFASSDTLLEDSEEESHFEKNLDRSGETGDKDSNEEKLRETSLDNIEILQSDQATEKCDLSIGQNKNLRTSNKIVLTVVPKSFVLQRNVSAQNNKALLKVVTTKPKAIEGTMCTTGVLPAKGTVLVTGKTMPAGVKNIPLILRTNQSTEKTLPTVVRSIPTSEIILPTVVRSIPTSDRILPTVVRSIPASERILPTVVRSIATSERTLPTVVRSIATSERTLPTVVRSIPTSEIILPTVVRSIATSERTLPTVLTGGRTERTVSSTESQNQKIINLSLERGTSTVTKSLRVPMSNLEHYDADAEPVRKKFKEDVPVARLTSDSCQTSTEGVQRLAREAVVRLQRLSQEEINYALHKS